MCIDLSESCHRYGVPASAGPSSSSRLKAGLQTNRGSWRAPLSFFRMHWCQQGAAADASPAKLLSDSSTDKMPAAPYLQPA